MCSAERIAGISLVINRVEWRAFNMWNIKITLIELDYKVSK